MSILVMAPQVFMLIVAKREIETFFNSTLRRRQGKFVDFI
ncbi:hypothetical protein SAMN05192543_11176 [Paraburkholderia megapolitana]|uniref:Uncharacterized protein n=1 Tax=Paraburkholderia megapolitana TaxID=420953 RepID=A0A1I3UDY6_9BURK|nr:hypothetical protein SAMN05192543_11176 [Paraburkholderia megapolitana]